MDNLDRWWLHPFAVTLQNHERLVVAAPLLHSRKSTDKKLHADRVFPSVDDEGVISLGDLGKDDRQDKTTAKPKGGKPQQNERRYSDTRGEEFLLQEEG